MEDQQRKPNVQECIATFFGAVAVLLFEVIAVLFLIAAGGEPTMFGLSSAKAMTYITNLSPALLLSLMGYIACRFSV